MDDWDKMGMEEKSNIHGLAFGCIAKSTIYLCPQMVLSPVRLRHLPSLVPIDFTRVIKRAW